MNVEEFVFEILKFEIHKGGPNNSAVLQNWFPPQEIKSPLFKFMIHDSWKLRKVLLNHVECIEI